MADAGWEKGDNLELDDKDKVANVVGSSGDRGNWIKYWLEHSGRRVKPTCSIFNCSAPSTDGAHVYVKNVKAQNHYFIIPMCHSCNMSNDFIYDEGWADVKKGTIAVATTAHPSTKE